MNLVNRVRNILLSPATEWPVIEREQDTVASIYMKYVLILAAIPAVAGFIGMSVFGIGGFGVRFRMPFVAGLVQMVLSYGMSLAMFYVLALIVDALAPTFGGQKNPVQAFKVVAYSMTAAMVAGIFSILPALAILGLLGALWSIWLLYNGLPVLMKAPKDKAIGYTAVVVICGIVVGVVIGAVVGAVVGAMTPSPMSMGGGSGVTIDTPQGSVNLDEMARKMEEAGKRMEEASKSGDANAMGAAAGAMAAAMGAGGRTPVPAQELKALLPETLGGIKRSSFESQGGAAMGINMSSAEAEYRNDAQSLSVTITDVGGLTGLAAMAGWMNMTGEREDEYSTERVYKQGDRTLREEAQKDGSAAEVSAVLAGGVVVEVRGEGLPLAAVKQALDSIDLGRLESLAAAQK
nr:Yip1 family protein [uncultured Caldimonas sp.]